MGEIQNNYKVMYCRFKQQYYIVKNYYKLILFEFDILIKKMGVHTSLLEARHAQTLCRALNSRAPPGRGKGMNQKNLQTRA